jgi:hypothetical protein
MGGFELEIELRTSICSETGKPYIRRYYNNNYEDDDDFVKIYDLPVIPEQYRPYVSMCGKVYYYYIENTGKNPYRGSAHVSTVLAQFPTWETIVFHTEFFPSEWWTEERHKEFKEFLLWCLDTDANYRVRWERD